MAKIHSEKIQFNEQAIYTIISTKLNVLKANLLNHQFAKFIRFMECDFNTLIEMLNSFVRHVSFWSWSNFPFIEIFCESFNVVSCFADL